MATNAILREDVQALLQEEVSPEIIEGVRKSSVALAHARRLPDMPSGEVKMPVLSLLPLAGFVSGDMGLKPVSKIAWKDKLLVAAEIAAIVPIPENVLNDTNYDIWGQVRTTLIEAFGRVLDLQVFQGGQTNAPTAWPTAIIPAAIAAGQTVALGTGADVAEDFNQLLAVLENRFFNVNSLIAQMNIRPRLRGLRATDNAFIYGDPTRDVAGQLYGVPIEFVGDVWNAATASAVAVDWQNVVYSMRQDMTYKVLDQAVITDSDSNIIFNLAQQDMVALRAVMRVAWQYAVPADIDRKNSADAVPFAVLRPA
jgi:HK97 family phage major capsid protein